MFLNRIDLTTALRPSYLPEEVLLFVQDNVGLYEGKYKLPNQQNGQVYLTSHRICYVDKEEPRTHSVSLDLKDVDKCDFYAGFLKSSAKITLIPKPLRGGLRARAASNATTPNKSSSPASGTETPFPPPAPQAPITWVCTICSFSNVMPAGFDPTTANQHTSLPPCQACGIKPSLSHILKTAIASQSQRSEVPPLLQPTPTEFPPIPRKHGSSKEITCPRCTFSNHISMTSCEMCGHSLVSKQAPSTPTRSSFRTESPGPTLGSSPSHTPDLLDGVKLSFRGGGEKIFYERLKSSMTQRKWLLQNAPPVPSNSRPYDDTQSQNMNESARAPKTAGIAGLEQLGLNMRKNNEILIGSAFEDLEALMASAKEVVALAERFSRQNSSGGGTFSAEESAILAESASQLGLITTKEMLGGGKSESLYLSELSRNVAEFLTDDARGVLKKAGGILTLVDLWAMFNRARGGVELVSPMDFEKAARLWESLKLPVRLRTFRSGVMVVQGRDRTDDVTIASIVSWMQDLHEFPPDNEVAWDWREFGRGVTPQDAAERFGWSLGVAEEELLVAEERGVLCREEGLEGLKFWENFIGSLDPNAAGAKSDEELMLSRLRNMGLV